MKICEVCAKYIQEGGIDEKDFFKDIKETDREIEEFSRSLERDN